MNIKGIIFDLDGTLLDTVDDLADSCNRTLKQYGFPKHPVESYKYFVGNGVQKLVERAMPDTEEAREQKHEFLTRFHEDYTAHCFDKTRPYPGIPQMLKKLSSRKIPMAILSNKPDTETRIVTDHYFGTDLFQRIYGHRDNVETKPDPAGAKAILNELKLDAGSTAFVGDTWIDMQTARNTGCIAVGVLWGFRDRRELEKNGARKIAAGVDDLYRILTDD